MLFVTTGIQAIHWLAMHFRSNEQAPVYPYGANIPLLQVDIENRILLLE